MAAERPSREHVLAAHPSVPDHVVYREFVNETVVLNLDTGRYHGLNSSGGKMLQTLAAAKTVRAAATALSDFFQRPLERMEQDLYEFCLDLSDRGLLELQSD